MLNKANNSAKKLTKSNENFRTFLIQDFIPFLRLIFDEAVDTLHKKQKIIAMQPLGVQKIYV